MRTQCNSSGSCPADSPGRGKKVQDIPKLYWSYLKICLSFRLECDNHETDEDVDHEEGEDDDVDHVEGEDIASVVEDGSLVLCVRIDGSVEDLWPSFKGLREHKIKKRTWRRRRDDTDISFR